MFGYRCRNQLRHRSGSGSHFQEADTRRRTYIGLRKVERKRAALSHLATKLDFAAEQTGQLTADSKSESGAAILTASPRVRLLKCFEDDSLLLGGDPDASVLDLESDDGWCTSKNGMVFTPTPLRQEQGQSHAALL